MKTLSRRTILRGAAGSAMVSVALPPLDAMMNDSGTAYASGESFPRRFGVFFWGNGVLPERWVPPTEGAGWSPSPLLAPLAPVREKLLVVSGLRVATLNTEPHASGPAGLLTGDQLRNRTYSAPTIDQRVAEVIGDETRFRSLETGVQPSTHSLSHRGPNLMNPTETDPAALFRRLFGDGFQPPGSGGAVDPRLSLKRSVLDAVKDQAARLKVRLGSADRQRLERHLDGIRALERQLQKLQESPPKLDACRKPEAPPAEVPDLAGRTDMRTRSRLMSELLALALACDQTRVFFHMYSQPVSDTLYPNAPAGHHQLTHDEPGDQPHVQAILKLVMEDLAHLVASLRAVPEGGETLLDHSILLCTSDCSYGRTHSLEEYPVVLAGGASLGLRQNFHLRARDENASKLSFSLLQLLGVRAAEFGVGPGRVTEPLAGLLS